MNHISKSIEVVVGVIRNINQEIFITKRQKNQFMSGYWELPGGKVENDESHSSAINRELFEETGVSRQSIISILKRSLNFQCILLKNMQGFPQALKVKSFAGVALNN